MSLIPTLAQIMRQGTSVAITRFVLVMASFFSSIIVARALPVEERGLFGLVMASAMLAIQFGNFGLPVANTYLIAARGSATSDLIGNTIRLFLTALCLFAIIQILLSINFPDWRPLQGYNGIITWALAVSGLWQLLIQNILIGKLQFTANNNVELLARFGGILIMLLFWQAGVNSTIWFGAGLVVVTVIAAGWGIRSAGLNLFPSLWNTGVAVQQLRLGVRAYVACLATFALTRVPLYASECFEGFKASAYFAQALVVTDTMLLLPVSFGTVLFPHLAGLLDSACRKRTTILFLFLVILVMLIAAGLVAWLSPYFMPSIYGSSYAASVPLLMLMLPGVVAFSLSSITQNSLSANGYPWSTSAAPLTGLTVTITTLKINPSLQGCAISYSCGAGAMMLVSVFFWWKSKTPVVSET